MRQSNAFIAIVVLISTALLIFYGIAALSPLQQPVNAPAAQTLTPLDKPKVDFANPRRGAAKPLVTVVVFGDYLCAPCGQMEDVLASLLKDFPDQVAVVWKDFPNEALHPGATEAAMAARCADLQGAFWEYHDIMMANQQSVGPSNFGAFATEIGIDPASLQSCIDGKNAGPIIDRDVEEGVRLRLTATPYLFVNDRRIEGAIGYDQLKSLVQSDIIQSGAKPESAGPAVNAPAPAPANAPINAPATAPPAPVTSGDPSLFPQLGQ